MQSKFLIYGLVIGLVLGLSATGFTQVLWLSDKKFDFDEIPQGKPVKTTFRFKNISQAPIVIELVRTTCGCTVPEWSKTPVEPGGIGVIQVVYDARKLGWFHKKIRVFFEGVRRGQKLAIMGEVYE